MSWWQWRISGQRELQATAHSWEYGLDDSPPFADQTETDPLWLRHLVFLVAKPYNLDENQASLGISFISEIADDDA